MKLVLHIGFHKTGSSALQTFCKSNRGRLAKLGILYPKTGESTIQFPSTPSSEGGHRSLEDVLASPTNKKSRNKLQKIVDEAQERSSDINTVLISSETFSAPKRKISTAVPKVFKEYFSDVKVVIYLRRQDQWSETFYKEVLGWSRKKETRNFKQFQEKFLKEWLDYGARIRQWEKIFGKENLLIKSYDDRECRNVIVDFFHVIGYSKIESEDLEFLKNINPSLPSHLVPLMREINTKHLTRAQKSEITNWIYKELEKSDTKVPRVSVMSDSLREAYIRTYGPLNSELCDRYEIENCQKLTFADNNALTAVDDQETTLSKEKIAEILDKVDASNVEKMPRDMSRRKQDQGRVGISCLLNEKSLQTEIFVRYHLDMGVDRIRLYFDNPDDPMADFDFESAKVEIIRCDDAFWQRVLGREPQNNGEKLSVCHKDGLNYLCQRDDIDWAINLDADELLYVPPGNTLQNYLSGLSAKIDQLKVSPLEAVFVKQEDSRIFSARYFKVPRVDSRNEWSRGRGAVKKGFRLTAAVLRRFSRFGFAKQILVSLSGKKCIFMPWSDSDENLYNKHMPVLSKVMREGFLAHREGRTFTRHGIELDLVTSHRPRYSANTLKIRRINNTVFVLHYDAADYEAWHLKWHRRIFGNTTASAIHEKRKMQQDMFRVAAEQGDDALKQLFNDLFVFPESSIRRFEREGLLVKLDIPELKAVKNKIENRGCTAH